jgi:RNA recognition motif-containing protein
LRRIILFQEVDSRISLKDFLGEYGIMEKVVNIDESNKDYIKVFFDSEEDALEAIKKIEKIKWENVRINR